VALSSSGRDEELSSKISYRAAEVGDVLRLEGPSGGGYGPPSEREQAARDRDVDDGLAPIAEQ
jgi:N-methylhydantoinase B